LPKLTRDPLDPQRFDRQTPGPRRRGWLGSDGLAELDLEASRPSLGMAEAIWGEDQEPPPRSAPSSSASAHSVLWPWSPGVRRRKAQHAVLEQFRRHRAPSHAHLTTVRPSVALSFWEPWPDWSPQLGLPRVRSSAAAASDLVVAHEARLALRWAGLGADLL